MKFPPVIELTNEIITELEMFKHFVRELPDKADAHLIIAGRKIEQLQREAFLMHHKSGEVNAKSE
jgi:hypothetical protein